jgi:trimeric autotransporter adhesin
VGRQPPVRRRHPAHLRRRRRAQRPVLRGEQRLGRGPPADQRHRGRLPGPGNDNVQPLWISRHFDSVYSLAITEQAVYTGGHFSFQESPTAPDPWPGLDDVGYGTGQGLSGYGLGDAVVRRDHIGALNPADGKALEWNPLASTFEGNKAMEATPRGLLVGGDGMYKGGVRTGRVAFFDFSTNPAPRRSTRPS